MWGSNHENFEQEGQVITWDMIEGEEYGQNEEGQAKEADE